MTNVALEHFALKWQSNFFKFFWNYWCLNSGPRTYWAGAFPLESLRQPCFVLSVFETGSLNVDTPDLCLLSSLDYRCEPLEPADANPLCLQCFSWTV
jgi:hypothetical protein